ncbi:hypothetical protein HAX54_003870 [Datura stramonium]|uniref:1,3-beta-glucan synthase component FKS1-like domain-containing protein n=1 Tax=Datura stramonium TaxID=4076 RepID=A0ABS8T885_DATST|nr:hypothetical protein [Datura stramonium]
MAMELNKILKITLMRTLADHFCPQLCENAFLNRIVKPIYDTIRAEVDNSRNGTAPHSAWRNYDDINEYFWSRRCFDKLKWPIDIGSTFFVTTNKGKKAAIIVAWEGKSTVAGFESRRFRRVLTIFFTWRKRRFLQSLLDAGMQCRLSQGRPRGHGVRMVLKSVVAAGWIVVFGVFYGRIWTQRNTDGN